ncbi:MAG: 50S ribosomal protein L10 [Acidobacteria bacterium]|nr:50S ribosomal protein L10 [Acidobacteriota bacterium]
MNRSEKQTFVEDLNKMFKASTSVLLINFEGVNVLAQSELRREISKVDSGYQVIKNRLALRAVEDTSLEVLREHFQGPTAIAYTGGDPVALAKVLKNFISDHPSVAFKAGVVEGKTFSASDVELLAKMPSRPELMSKLVYLLNAPLVRLATALQSPLRGLASVLKQLAEQKQASGEGATDDSSTDNGQQTADSGQAEQEAKEQEAAPEPEKQEPAEQEAAAPEPKEQQAEEETPAPEVAEQEAKEQEATPEPEKPEAKEQETAAQEPEAQEETAPEPAAEEPVAEEPAAEEPTAEEPVAEEKAAQEAAAPEAASEEKADEETTDQEKKDEETDEETKDS